MTIHFVEEYELDLGFDKKELAKKVIEYAVDYENCPYEVEVNVIFTNDEDIAQINKEYRNVESSTDVLSFPLLEYEQPGDFDFLEDSYIEFNPDTGELMLGDIIVSLDKVVLQAEKFGHTVSRELGFLIAHSMLHLFGYDHIDDSDRIQMESKQDEILNNLHIYR